MGDPATELIKVAAERSVDLIAMSTHGHRFIKDVLLGATADRVRHLVKIPVLLLRAQQSLAPSPASARPGTRRASARQAV